MIKKITQLFLSSILLFSIVCGSLFYFWFGLKIFSSNIYFSFIIILAITFFLLYAILSSMHSAYLEKVLKEYVDSKLGVTGTTETINISEPVICDVDNLTYKDTDLTLNEYNLRVQFVEGSGYPDNMDALIGYLESRILDPIDYRNLDLPTIVKIIKKCDEHVPQSTLDIIYADREGTSKDFDVFGSIEDIDTSKLN